MECLAEYIFAAVLGLYMGEGAQSLPNSDEVLICTSETTSEEVLTSSVYATDMGVEQPTLFVLYLFKL